jgi:hypothetical protein
MGRKAARWLKYECQAARKLLAPCSLTRHVAFPALSPLKLETLLSNVRDEPVSTMTAQNAIRGVALRPTAFFEIRIDTSSG